MSISSQLFQYKQKNNNNMNLEQFLSQEPIDKLFQQFFSVEGQTQKSKSQQNVLINSIVLYIASNHTFNFKNLYEECQYQLQVYNQQRDAVNKMCRLICGVVNKAPYLVKNIDIKFFVDEVLEFLLSKVFVTVCSAECIRCIWSLVNAFNTAYTFSSLQITSQKGCCSTQKSCCESKSQMKDQRSTNGGCCKDGSQKESISNCCQSVNEPQQSTSSLISKHQRVCKSIVTKFLKTFKLHVKAYPFKVRKDIYKLIYYVLKFTKFSQEHFLKSFSEHERYEREHFEAIQTQPLFVEIGFTKQQLIETTIKNLSDEKDPRNMQLIFQNYLLLISLFSQEISIFNYRAQLFENIEVYYPLSMQGDQSEFQIQEEDRFSEFQLKQLLDQCLLAEIFCNEVRQLLVEKMSAPPINDYVSLYVKYITKFNPVLWKSSSFVDSKLHAQKYAVLTLNLLHRLCQQQYLDETYSTHGGSCNDSPGDSCCGGNKSKPSNVSFSISQLIATIIKNVFISSMSKNNYSVYLLESEQKFAQFLNALVVSKLFNHEENHKHAGTIIDIVKTVLNSDVIGKNMPQKTTKNTQKPKQASSCCSGNQAQSCCSLQQKQSSTCCQTISHSSSNITLKQQFGKKVNFEQMLINYVILKFMQFWSAKGDVAFKLGLLIISLNKKLETISTQQWSAKIIDESTENLMQHLLITLGNVYEAYLSTGQVKIMVLKAIMIIAGIYNKFYQTDVAKREKVINKVIKVNNGLIHKDCIKFAQFLNNPTEENLSTSPFIRSEQPILKSYIDYIMEMYVGSFGEKVSEQTIGMIRDIFGSFTKLKTNEKITANEESQFDVKLYALMRYLSIVGFQKISENEESKLLSQGILRILFSSNRQTNKNLIGFLKFYSYPSILSILKQIIYHFSTINQLMQNVSQSSIEDFFINLSLIGSVLKEKFTEYYTVELESGESSIELIARDIQKNGQKNQKEKFSAVLLMYILKSLWRQQLTHLNQSDNALLSELMNFSQDQSQSNQKSISAKIIQQAKLRLQALKNLYTNQSKLQSLNLEKKFDDLQCNLLYIKYLKANNKQFSIQFNPNLGQLYDAGVIEYFWNRLFNEMTSQEKSLISSEKKKQLVGLLEYLPQRILVNYAGKVAPLIIYATKNMNDMVQENKQQNLSQKDEFDFSMSQLISKLCNNLPEESLISYVVPYCLSYLKLAAISCQNGTDVPSTIIPVSQTLNVLLNIGKIVHILIEKSQQKSAQRSFKHQKLRKSILEVHKKQFKQYYSRLIYHKKRLIRQSSRSLLMSFE